MKYIITSFLILFSSISFASRDGDVFVTDNQSEGKIYLFSDPCPVNEMQNTKLSLTTGEDTYTFGCWIIYGDQFLVVWFPNDSAPVTSIYEIEIFFLEKLI